MIAVLLAIAAAAVAQAQAGWPEGPGAPIAQTKCLICHESDLIVSQRLSRAGWTREIDKMIRWGAPVTDAERETLAAYLATHFAPSPLVAHARAAEGEAVYKRACLICHETDLVDQQRLSRPGWVREVDKMIRWGAPVPDGDKDPLVDYLASRVWSR